MTTRRCEHCGRILLLHMERFCDEKCESLHNTAKEFGPDMLARIRNAVINAGFGLGNHGRKV